MAGRAAVPREERFTALEALFVPSFMNFREARILGPAERVTRSYHFRTGLRSGNASDYPEFLNGPFTPPTKGKRRPRGVGRRFWWPPSRSPPFLFLRHPLRL